MSGLFTCLFCLSPRLTIKNSFTTSPRPTQDFERECVGFFEEVAQVFGIPKSVGQIYGLLYASPVSLSLSFIVGRLEISKGSASQGLQLLRSLGAVNLADRVGKESKDSNSASHIAMRASLSVSYEPELSIRRLMSGVLQGRVAPMAATGADRLKRLREIAGRDGQERDFFLGRVKQLEKWRRRVEIVLPMLGALLGPKSKR